MHLLHSTGLQNSHLGNNLHRFLSSGGARSGPAHHHRAGAQSSRDGIEVFQASLSKHYQQVSSKAVAPVVKAQEQRLTADTVANNILGFIEQRLRKEEAAGATPQELEARLEEGLAGFKHGFAEAKEKIEALGLLSPEVEEDIGLTFDLVVGGVEDLRGRYVEGEAKSSEKVDSNNDVAKLGDSAKLSASFGQVSYKQVNSFKFEVETADGDVVSISARSKDLYAAEYRAGTYATGNSAGMYEQFNSVSRHSNRFDLQVSGELDDDELRALDQLLGKVEDLSADFFGGDLDSAMQQALNLGYDTEEIVGYSLNLRQVEVQRVAVAYQSVEPAATPINPLAARLQPLGNFAQDLLDALNQGSKFADPAGLVADLSEQIDLNQPVEEADTTQQNRFSDFIKDLLDALPTSTQQ